MRRYAGSLIGFTLLTISLQTQAAPSIRSASGANAAAIQATVDQFRSDLGGSNNGVGGSFATGRREINWDAVPDSFAAPNFLPANFFNSNSPRGAVFNTVDESTGFNDFRVSADSSNPTNTPVRFGDIDASYSSTFTTFSAERLFQARNAHVLDVSFFIPGTTQPASVSGFGVVFSDVDESKNAIVKCYGVNGNQLAGVSTPEFNQGLSFVGFTFTSASERCYRVLIISGDINLASGVPDENNATDDVIAMDDFIYGEPQPVF